MASACVWWKLQGEAAGSGNRRVSFTRFGGFEGRGTMRAIQYEPMGKDSVLFGGIRLDSETRSVKFPPKTAEGILQIASEAPCSKPLARRITSRMRPFRRYLILKNMIKPFCTKSTNHFSLTALWRFFPLIFFYLLFIIYSIRLCLVLMVCVYIFKY